MEPHTVSSPTESSQPYHHPPPPSSNPAKKPSFLPIFLPADRTIAEMKKRGYIDEACNWIGGGVLEELDEKEILRLKATFEKAFEVIDNRNGDMGIKASIYEVLCQLNYYSSTDFHSECQHDPIEVEECELVGSSVFHQLGLRYIRRCCERQQIPLDQICDEGLLREVEKRLSHQPNDIDIRFHIPRASRDTMAELRNALISFLSARIPYERLTFEKKEELADRLRRSFPNKYFGLKSSDPILPFYFVKECVFSKYYITKPDNPAQFAIAGFGDRKETLVEWLFVKHLPQQYLFGRDSTRIPFLSLYYQQRSSRPISELNGGWQAIVEILTDGFTIPYEDNLSIDHWLRAVFHYTKGLRCHTPGGEDKVCNVLLKSLKHDEGDILFISKILRNYLLKRLNVDPIAALFMTFNALRIFYGKIDNKTLEEIRRAMSSLWKGLADNTEHSAHMIYLLGKAMENHDIPFEQIQAVFNAAVFFHMNQEEPVSPKEDLVLSLSKNAGIPAGYIRVKHQGEYYGMIIGFDPAGALKTLLSPGIDKLEELYQCLLPSMRYSPLGKSPLLSYREHLSLNVEEMATICFNEPSNPVVYQYGLCLHALGHQSIATLLITHFLPIIHSPVTLEMKKQTIANMHFVLLSTRASLPNQHISETLEKIQTLSDQDEAQFAWMVLLSSSPDITLQQFVYTSLKERVPHQEAQCKTLFNNMIRNNPALAFQMLEIYINNRVVQSHEAMRMYFKVFRALLRTQQQHPYLPQLMACGERILETGWESKEDTPLQADLENILKVAGYLIENENAMFVFHLFLFAYQHRLIDNGGIMVFWIIRAINKILMDDPLKAFSCYEKTRQLDLPYMEQKMSQQKLEIALLKSAAQQPELYDRTALIQLILSIPSSTDISKWCDAIRDHWLACPQPIPLDIDLLPASIRVPLQAQHLLQTMESMSTQDVVDRVLTLGKEYSTSEVLSTLVKKIIERIVGSKDLKEHVLLCKLSLNKNFLRLLTHKFEFHLTASRSALTVLKPVEGQKYIYHILASAIEHIPDLTSTSQYKEMVQNLISTSQYKEMTQNLHETLTRKWWPKNPIPLVFTSALQSHHLRFVQALERHRLFEELCLFSNDLHRLGGKFLKREAFSKVLLHAFEELHGNTPLVIETEETFSEILDTVADNPSPIYGHLTMWCLEQKKHKDKDASCYIRKHLRFVPSDRDHFSVDNVLYRYLDSFEGVKQLDELIELFSPTSCLSEQWSVWTLQKVKSLDNPFDQARILIKLGSFVLTKKQRKLFLEYID
ncbi:MAG: hypothetical protein K940chlam7_00907, partial [Chlamydiae bacterium]|nr:hypothetical protein [Chlamydiota bacterium]